MGKKSRNPLEIKKKNLIPKFRSICKTRIHYGKNTLRNLTTVDFRGKSILKIEGFPWVDQLIYH